MFRNSFKLYGMALISMLLMSVFATQVSAKQYSIANFLPLLNANPNDERVYEWNGAISFERSGGVMPARSAPAASDGPTVPANVIEGSDGYTQLWTIDATGFTEHGAIDHNPSWPSKSYDYSFIAPPASAAAVTMADFNPTNLTTPAASLPAIIDTAVKTVFTRVFANVQESTGFFGGTRATYVKETITVDDNAGLLFDLTNPANPDYDAAYVATWRVRNGGTGAAAPLKKLLKLTIQRSETAIGGLVSKPITTTIYLASGIGIVYMIENNPNWFGPNGVAQASISKLMKYSVAAKSGASAGIVSAKVQVHNLLGGVPANSYVFAAGPLVTDPVTGQSAPAYTFNAYLERTPGSGLFKIYYNQGDLLDLQVSGSGFVDQSFLAQNITALAAASAPAPVVYKLVTPKGTISGKLTSPTGAAVANVRIDFTPKTIGGGWQQPIIATTNAVGNYSAFVDPTIAYQISVPTSINWSAAVSNSLPVGSVGGVVAQNGGIVAGAGGSFTAASGVTNVVNIQLALGATLSGQLLDVNGIAYANARVGVSGSSAVTDATGHYSVTVLPGSYTVSVSEGFNPTTGQPIPFPVGMVGGQVGATGALIAGSTAPKQYLLAAGTTTILNMQLAPGAVIKGKLIDLNGLPYANANILLNNSTTGASGFASTDATGNYSITVAPGSYTLQVSEGWNSVTSQPASFPAGLVGGYADVTGKLNSFKNATLLNLTVATPTVLNIQLASGAIVSGTLLDTAGTPFAHASIQIFDSVAGVFTSTSTDVNGRYSKTLVPGSYTILVTQGVDPAIGQLVPFPAGMMGGYVDVTGALTPQFNAAKTYAVTSGTTTVVNMQLLAGAVISGTLTDANGAAYANAFISIFDPAVAGIQTTTDIAGKYSLTVAPGSYTIQVFPGYDPVTGKQVPFPAGMMGGYVDVTGALTQNFNLAKTFVMTPGLTTVVNMQLVGAVQAAIPPANILLAVGLGDVNGNRSGDIAVLGKRKSTGNYVVRVKDPNTVPHLIREIRLNNAYLPVELLKMPDMNGNGSADIAVLEVDPVTQLNRQIQVKDGRTGAKIVNISLKRSLMPVQMVVLPDANGNGSADLAVLEVDPATGLNRQIQVKDGKTGALIQNIRVSTSVKPHMLVSLGLINGVPALALSEVDAVTGKNVQVQVKNARTGAKIVNIRVKTSVKPHMLVALPDVNGNGSPDLALSEVDAVTGKNALIQVKDGKTGALIQNIRVSTSVKPHRLVSVGNINGAPALALSEVHATTGKIVQIQVKNARTGAKVRNVLLNRNYKPSDLIVLADINGNGAPELALSEVNATTGKIVQVQVKDSLSGAKIRNIPMNPNYTPLGMGSGPDSNGNGVAEIGLLEVDGAGNVQVQIKDPLTGAKVSNLAYPNF